MARTEDSRRVEDAGHRDLRTDRLPASATVAATAQPDLEDLPAQPPWSNGLDGLLHRAHDHDEGAVRVSGSGTSPSRGAAFSMTEHPSAAWTSQQIVEAFANQNPPRYLLRDQDRIYGNEVRWRIASLQMEQVLTADRSPWQNPYAERLIGSIRRDCLDHFVILNARHLKRTLSSYFAYYHGSRTHLGLDKQCPHARQVSSGRRIVKIPHLGGLHHRYERIAA